MVPTTRPSECWDIIKIILWLLPYFLTWGSQKLKISELNCPFMFQGVPGLQTPQNRARMQEESTMKLKNLPRRKEQKGQLIMKDSQLNQQHAPNKTSVKVQKFEIHGGTGKAQYTGREWNIFIPLCQSLTLHIATIRYQIELSYKHLSFISKLSP